MRTETPDAPYCVSSLGRAWALVLALLLGFWLGEPEALADGKVFSPVAVASEVTMPDQRALLVWSNGVERLAIETRIVGEGTNFAWVVPLPSAPKVEASTVGLFPTLSWLTPPKVLHQAQGAVWWVWCASGIAWLFLRVRKATPLEWTDPVAILVACAGLFGVAGRAGGLMMSVNLATLCGWIVWRVRRGEPWWGSTALLFLLLTLMSGMLLPALATAKGDSLVPQGADGVQVLERQVAGVFESTTVTSRDPAALEGWLKTNGYRVPDAARPVIEAHVRDGWVFVASRVRREVAVAGPQALHPLVFTFATPKPVYPLRLTGVGNGPLKVELYVLGPGRARIAGFDLLDARPVVYRDPELDPLEHRGMSRSDFNVLHPGLRTLASEAPFATRLRATLSPEQMREDAIVDWDPAEPFQRVVYSTRGAVLKCVQGFGGAWLVGMVLLAAAVRLRPGLDEWLARWALGSLALAGVAGAIGFLLLPTVPVRIEMGFAWVVHRRLADTAFAMAVLGLDESERSPSVEAVRAAIRKSLSEDPVKVGGAMIEEDSPRNYIVRAIPGDVEVVYFNEYGQALPRRVSEMRRRER